MKKLRLVVMSLCAMFVAVVSVNAATIDNLIDWGVVEKTGGQDKTYELKLNVPPYLTPQDIVLQDGENVTLDLNGQTLQNYSDNNAVFVIPENASLTIKGTGTIKTKDSVGSASTIDNQGTLTILGGVIETSRTGAAAVNNSGVLTINGEDVELKTTVNGAWGLVNKDEGEAVIKAGKFVQTNNFSIVLNTGKLTIEGGEFSATGSGHYSLLSTTGKGETDITGGEFATEENNIFYEKSQDEGEEAGKTTITGGTYTVNGETADISDYLPEDYETDEEGNVVLKDADYTDLETALKAAKEVDTTKYTEESVKALTDAIDAAEAVAKNLKVDEQEKIDAAVEALVNAIAGLEEIKAPVKEPEKADTTELEKAIAEAEKYLDDKKYDAKEVETLKKIIEEAKGLIGADKEGQETVDAMVEVLKDATTKVANTGDNIMSVVATGIASLVVIAGGIVLVRKNKFNN